VQIARELGCGRKTVRYLLGDHSQPPGERARCAGCHMSVGPSTTTEDRGPALCLPCLAQRPRATLGQRVRAHRLAGGLTCVALARKANVRPETLAALEQGHRQPYRRTLQRLASVLGVTPEDLAGRQPRKAPA
jgi:DNA-binding XRE family transcriptional regulator